MIIDRFMPPETFTNASDQLHEVVAGMVGSSNFGESDYLWPLRILLQSMDYDPIFSEHGKKIAWGLLIGALSSRAYAFQSMAQNPDFDKTPIRKPVVITGIPRTGTTALHKLMAVDPQFQGLQTWILNAPQPRPPRKDWEANPHFQEAVKQLEARFANVPGMRAAHNMAAEDVEECLWILRQSFLSNFWVTSWSAATYDAFWQTQSERASYNHFKRVVQLIGSTEPEKRWLLKNPGHISNLDLLFETFPDAMVIQTHRDPAKAVPSLVELLVQNMAGQETGRDAMRARNVGHREVEKWAKSIRDAEPVRQKHSQQVLDVIHSDFHRNPIPVIKRIYAFLGLELTPDVERAMLARVEEAPESAHGAHRYDPKTMGLTEEEIRERFGDYVQRFDLAPKGGR